MNITIVKPRLKIVTVTGRVRLARKRTIKFMNCYLKAEDIAVKQDKSDSSKYTSTITFVVEKLPELNFNPSNN